MTQSQLAEILYESCMYKLHEIERFNFIKDLWDNAEIMNSDEETNTQYLKDKGKKPSRSHKINLDYKRI